jgi:hypothetical protein
MIAAAVGLADHFYVPSEGALVDGRLNVRLCMMVHAQREPRHA